jgi:hypothetical protein
VGFFLVNFSLGEKCILQYTIITAKEKQFNLKRKLKMSLFNKEGKEFKNMISINKDPNVDPTYSYAFPVPKGNKIEMRFAKKIRPIQSLTRMLQGCRLKRNQDYMIDFNDNTDKYEYYFADGRHATMFALMCSTMTQPIKGPGHKFNIQCPHCNQQFGTKDIIWK